MIVRLQKSRTKAANDSLVSCPSLVEPSELAQGDPTSDELFPADRKLRNRIILANAIAWIVIIVGVRMIFF